MATTKTATPNLAELRQAGGERKRGRVSAFDATTQAARNKETSTRGSLATSRALSALSVLHRDDYVELLRQAKAEVASERGPLPGDPGYIAPTEA